MITRDSLLRQIERNKDEIKRCFDEGDYAHVKWLREQNRFFRLFLRSLDKYGEE